jgi:hypothetical protein
VLPLTQAGVMKRDMSQKIIDRCDRFLNRLPLLSQQMQRWGNLSTLSSETVPIVYAQNIASAAEGSNRDDQLVTAQVTSSNLPNTLPNSSSSSSSSEMPLQAKFANSEGLATDTSSISDRPTAKIISDSTGKFLEPQPPASERPIVSPEAIANPALSNTGEMTLQAKFASSESLASANSQSLPSLTSPPLTTEPSTQNISDYPVVTPKNNVEAFSVNQENLPLLLLTENLAVTSEPLPIAQVKLPNPDLPSSDLPVVNRLNNLNLANGMDNSPSPSQRDITQGKITQGQVYLRDRSPNYIEQINSQIFAANSPIVTSAETRMETGAIAESLISPNLESFQDHILPIVRPKSNAPSNIFTASSNINIKNIKGEQNPLPIVNPSAPNNLPQPQMYPITSSRNSASQNSTTKTASPQTGSETGARELKVFASPSPPTETAVSSMPNQPQIDAQVHAKIDVEAIANQVERKLMRRLVIESERRGHKR